MPLTQTTQETDTSPESQTTELKTKEPTQSVYIADKDVVKTYPVSMSNDEIDFDLHTTVRGKTPEDYYVNFLPLKALQNAFKMVFMPGAQYAPEAAIMAGKAYKKIDEEYLSPAMKLVATRPDVAFGVQQGEVTMEDIEKTYKPWIDIWQESEIGKEIVKSNDKLFLSDNGAVRAFAPVPWLFTEFLPEELLEFGTKPINWVGLYGVQRFGPPILNEVISELPTGLRSKLLKDIFAGEKALKPDFETLGIPINSRTSDVVGAYKNAARVTHPDVGGNPDEFIKVKTAYENIMKSRGNWMDKLFDVFRESPVSKPKAPVKKGLLGNQGGSVLIPSAGDLVKIGSEFGQVMNVTGELALVNVGGKILELGLDQISVVPKDTARREKIESLIDPKDITGEASKKEAAFVQQNLEAFDVAYAKKLKQEYGTDNPNIISSDVARMAEMEGRGALTPQGAADRHAISSAYSKMKYEEDISNPENKGKDVVVLAGVSGAGKTGAIRQFSPKTTSKDIIYDTNISSVESGKRIIEKALASDPDREVIFTYVDRDPIKAFEEGVVPRFLDPKKDKRLVSVPTHLNNVKSLESIIKLHDLYKDNKRVHFDFFGNYGKKGEYTKISIEDLKNKRYNLAEIGATLEKGIQQKLKSGILSPEAAKAFIGTGTPKQKNAQGNSRGSDGQAAVNLENYQVSPEAKDRLTKATAAVKGEIQNQTGKPVTHEEVIEAAKEAGIITQGVSREATLEFQASLLKTRRHLAALAEQNELTPEFLDTLRVMANQGTDIARSLESFKIEAMPEFAETKVKIIKDLINLGKSSEDILAAAKGVDFQDEQQVAKFYREFVKPKISEILDEFVYMNILSSPTTHIVNAFSNLIQLSGLNPITKLASGTVDFVASSLTGKARQHYVSEVPDFYKGALNAVPKALEGVANAMKGKRNLERPDVKRLPTLSKFVDVATLGIGKYVPRALEASDVFFRTMIEAGEIEALSAKLDAPPDEAAMAKIKKEAKKRADYYVFRSRPDADNKTGQGTFLSAIDNMTNAIYRLRAVPGLKWFIRFVQTPMNIFKQGVEYSPAGFVTMKGSKDKSEQAGKAIFGSLVFGGASWLAYNNLATWSAPSGQREKNEFYGAGLQPYSVRIGDKWVSYSKLGPLSYPIAMAAALHYYTKESPNALSDSEMDKVVDALTGIMKFFSDQSYMQGLGDLVSFSQGEKTRAVASAPTQLVPLSSLQGWVNNIMDPLRRKPAKGLSIESVIDQIQMKIVGMSKFVPAQIDMEEVPVKKQLRGINAISPARVSQVDAGAAAEYKDNQRIKQEVNKARKDLE